MTAVGVEDFREEVTDDVLDLTAEALGTVAVDGQNASFEIVGAHETEGALDDLAVTGFAFANPGFGYALDGDVDASRDDESDLSS